MKYRFIASCMLALLLSAMLSTAQISNPQGMPGTPPTFPSDQGKSGKTGPDTRLPSDPSSMPPDTKAPAPHAQDLQQQIEQALAKEPDLADSDIEVKVGRNNVILTGTVENSNDHALALRIAQSYAGERQVVDKLKLRG